MSLLDSFPLTPRAKRLPLRRTLAAWCLAGGSLMLAQKASALEIGMPADAGVSASPAVVLEAESTLEDSLREPLTLTQFASADEVMKGLRDGTLDAAYLTPWNLKALAESGVPLRVLDGADLDDVSLVARDELIRYTKLFEPQEMLIRFLNDTTRAVRVVISDSDARSHLALKQWIEVKVGSSMQLVSPRSLEALEGDEYAGDAPKALINSRKMHAAFLGGDDASRLVALHPLSKDWLPRANMLDLPRMLLVSRADIADDALDAELQQLGQAHAAAQRTLHQEDPTKAAFMLKQEWPAQAGEAPSLPQVVHALNGNALAVSDMRQALNDWLGEQQAKVSWPELQP
ncbi:hypothetical protein Q4589_02850 [Cobetia marina]|uniref:hypothetical protein n=1 Tax=Cobetia marina TaxID=28258 RepID=UPI0026E445B6|nr:hypothetical protein [Cobetia marina]MDO6786524.1 hypothetical protein [Cobetia marina]